MKWSKPGTTATVAVFFFGIVYTVAAFRSTGTNVGHALHVETAARQDWEGSTNDTVHDGGLDLIGREIRTRDGTAECDGTGNMR